MSGAANTTPSANGWQQAYPGQIIYPAVPSAPPMVYPQMVHVHRPTLSDFDIELMAACITNHHPVIDGQTHCFCMLKRLERGISKD